MSAPAVKPALPAPSGAQAPRVGSGAPNTAPPGAPPGAASSPQKLPSGTVGMSVSMSSVKPPIPPNANHAVATAVPLSLVQEHKVQGNALPQPPMALPRTPEKPKDLVVPLASPTGPKPTSNGVEGSPGKAPLPPVQLPPTIVDNKKVDDVSTAALLNHSAEGTVPASAAGPTSAPASSTASNATALPPVSAAPAVSSSSNTLPSIHPPVVSAQQSPGKPESTPAPATSNAAPTTAAPPPAPVAPAPAPVIPPKSSSCAPPVTVNSSSPSKSEATATTVPAAVEAKPAAAAAATTATAAAPATPVEEPAPTQPPTAPSSGPGPGAAAAPAPAPEAAAKPAPSAPPEVTKTRIEISKPEFKVATTPRVSKRKRETKPLAEVKAASEDPNDDRKSKRVRTRTQPYQSPLPELQYMGKFKNVAKAGDDKLIVFYKNEFLAVRNAEGSFYVCQAMQNIYKSSTRIRIRWLSQDKKENKETNVYIPDFYDVTEFDCILTNLELKKLDKNKYELPQEERDRTQNILKRALDVEKGVGEKPPVTEEHPDGLDLSLYRDEAQLKKKRSSKESKKAKKSKGSEEGKTEEGETETSEESQGEAAAGESEEDGGGSAEKKKKASKPPKSKASKKEKASTVKAGSAKEKAKGTRDKEGGSPKRERTSERGREREATKRKAEAPAGAASAVATSSKSTPPAAKPLPPPEKKAKVANTPKSARKAEKAEPTVDASVPTRATKSRSVKSAAAASATPPSNKTSPVTRTKERERRGAAATSSGRKKPGKKA